MTRQYIGARYVPKFFEDENGDPTWRDSIPYEPLTIVMYLGNSYTSKKAVPIGVQITDTEYWVLSGNYNLQVEQYRQDVDGVKQDVIEIRQDISDLDIKLSGNIDIAYLEYFRDKTICIIGDSISDNTTYPPNWVEAFKSTVSQVGATINNISTNGASIVGFYNELSIVPTGYDIYIVMLGVNDFQGEFSVDAVRPALFGLLNKIQTVSNDVFYVSPIKTYGESRMNKYTPLSMYREMFEKLASEMGAYVISGYNLPRLNTFTQSTALADTLHPASSFAPVIADYIIHAMLARVSTFSNTTRYMKVAKVIANNGGGNCVINVFPNFRFSVTINLLNVTLNQGWNDICEVSDTATNSLGLLSSGSALTAAIEWNTGTILQVKIDGGKLQLYSKSNVTLNPYISIEFFVPVNSMAN